MKELCPEVQIAIIDAAHQSAMSLAEMKSEGKKGNKTFTQVYGDTFEKNYRRLMDVVSVSEPETAQSL